MALVNICLFSICPHNFFLDSLPIIVIFNGNSIFYAVFIWRFCPQYLFSVNYFIIFCNTIPLVINEIIFSEYHIIQII